MAKDFMSGYKTYDTSNGFGNRRKWQESFNDRMTSDEATVIMGQQKETPEIILGVSSSDTIEQIKSAFKKLIMKWHPDKNPDNITEAEAMSKKLIAAYVTIMKKKEQQ